MPQHVDGQEREWIAGMRGDRVEVCPQGLAIVETLSGLIAERGGCALVCDYGQDGPSADSLVAIKDHKYLPNILDNAGNCDITANVDFGTMRRVVNNLPERLRTVVYGPNLQKNFLQQLHIESRVLHMLEDSSVDSETAEKLLMSYKRIVRRDEMGGAYKMFALVDGSTNKRALEQYREAHTATAQQAEPHDGIPGFLQCEELPDLDI